MSSYYYLQNKLTLCQTCFLSAANNYVLVLPACVSHVVGPVQSSVHAVAVLGFGDEQDKEKVFMALPETGR